MASAIAGFAATKAYKLLAANRSVLIPLDDISNTRVLTDTQIKKEFCKTPRRRKTNLERIQDRNS